MNIVTHKIKRLIVGSPLEVMVVRSRTLLQGLGVASQIPREFVDWYNNQIAVDILIALCNRQEIFLDVGAHIGSVTSCALRDGLKVIAVEAIPEKAQALRTKFPDIEVFECAVSDFSGEAKFFVAQKKSGYSGLSYIEDSAEIIVPVHRLDTLLPDQRIGTIKIDVEGAELNVLKGASALIARNRPVMMFESGPEEVFGITKREIWEWCDGQQLSIFCPDRVAHTGSAMTLDVFLDSHEYPRRTTNYIVLPREREGALRARAREKLRSA